MKLIINEIFTSISGEAGVSIPQGAWTLFIRLQGCNLGCAYCDSEKSRNHLEGYELEVSDIMKLVTPDIQHVIITGGEPLLQKGEALSSLCRQLYYAVGTNPTIETNGTIEPDCWDKCPAEYVVDVKMPSAMTNNSWEVSTCVFSQSEHAVRFNLKFVMATGTYDAAKDRDAFLQFVTAGDYVEKYGACDLIISPMDGNIQCEWARLFIEFMENNCPHLISGIVISPQIHKLFGLA